MVAFEAGVDDFSHAEDMRHHGIETSRMRRVDQREIRLHSLDLQQVVLPQDLHLVKRDQPVQVRRGRSDGADDVHTDQQEDDGVDRQTDNDLPFHQSFL